MRASLSLALLALALSTGLGAAQAVNTTTTYYDAAKSAMPTLAAPVGVRAIGMGEAYTAAGDDLASLHWNPAGLAGISGFQVGLIHNELSSSLGVRQEYLGYGQGLGNDSGIAVALNYFNLGTLTKRDLPTDVGQDSAATALNGTLGYAFSLMDNNALRMGLQAEYGMESFLGAGISGFGAGLGLQYNLGQNGTLGASVLHLGSAGAYNTPAAGNVGVAWGFNRKMLLVALDGNLPFAGAAIVRAGAELNVGGAALRAGWRQAMGAPEGDTAASGFTAGAGYKAGVFNIDYAFVPYGSIATAHRVSVGLDLPADFFRPKIVDAGASTRTAKSYYERALAEEKQGKYLGALVLYQRSKDAYPQALIDQKHTQNFYQVTLRKIELIQAEMAKSGNNEQVRRLVAKALNEGRSAMQGRRYRDAIKSAKDALALDSESKDAKALLEEAHVAMRQRKRELLGQGASEYDAGRLSTAVSRYRDVLRLDAGDEDAQAFFVNHRPEITEHLKKLKRKGIDLYVSGRIKDAVAQWKDGLSIDPEDPINFRRDIEKAEKVLEVRGGR